MITKDQMLVPMLAACPSFMPAWQAFVAEWAHDDDPPLYLALGDLARHLIEGIRSDATTEFPAVFEVVERWHLEGDHFVREAATIGLLEGIQNVGGNTGVDPALFETWLLPESRKWWDRLNRFWGGDAFALREG
jgi:hypothetical protein